MDRVAMKERPSALSVRMRNVRVRSRAQFKIAVIYNGIIRSKFEEQALILNQERSSIGLAIVPKNDKPTARPQDSFELAVGFVKLKPVKRLSRKNKIDRCI